MHSALSSSANEDRWTLTGGRAEQRTPLGRYAAAIQRQRGDYNGRMLTLRAEDLRALSAIYGNAAGEVTEQLLDAGVLAAGAQPTSSAPAQP